MYRRLNNNGLSSSSPYSLGARGTRWTVKLFHSNRGWFDLKLTKNPWDKTIKKKKKNDETRRVARTP